MRTINHESDFKITEGFKDGSSILAAPFRFTYYTKVTRGVYVAEYNGSEYVNCHPTDDGRVVVPFDSPKLGMGVLMVKREFFLNDKDFADGICNLVSVESTGITLDKGATDMDGEVNIELFPFYQQGETGKSAYQEWLDLGNEGTTADFIASLRGAAFTYEDFTEDQLAALKGEKGDKMTYDDLTEEQKEDLAKKVIGDAEDERRAAEIVRQENEVTREEQEAKRIETFNTNESQREDAFNTAQSQMAQDFQESQTSRNNIFATNEDSRQENFETNEQERQSIFAANESERRIAETSRQGREAMRVTSENSRESAETQRKLAEIGRENTFAANEQTRQTTFEDNEEKREEAFDAAIQAAKDNLIVVNDLTTGGDNKALSAEMGKTLYDKLRLSSSLYINSQGYLEVKVDERTIRSTYDGLERAPLKLRQDYYRENPDILLDGGLVADEDSYYNFPTLKVGTLDDTIEVEYQGIKVSSSVIKKLDETNTLALKLSSDIESYATKENVEELKGEFTDAIEQIEGDKVDKDDNAPKLTAGFANNLVGRGEATDEEISFRPSGGDTSIEDGTARIERLKGNTVVWNQTYPTGWNTSDLGVTSVSTKDGVVTMNGTLTSVYFNIKQGASASIPVNHTGLYICEILSDKTKFLQGKLFILHNRGARVVIKDKYNYFFYTNTDTSQGWGIGFTGMASGDVITDIQIRVAIYDLTKMFGTGNEPTTIEEFNARKPIGMDEYAYNEGELISTTADEIKSVGFNAWDEEWEYGDIGEDGENISSTVIIRSKNYIPLIPNQKYRADYPNYSNVYMGLKWYDNNKNLISRSTLGGGNGQNFNSGNDCAYARFTFDKSSYSTICIHLVHTGYRNGEYEPYKEFRRSLPISEIKDSDGNQLFPNGLLSAGSAYDEITATKAIKRVGTIKITEEMPWGKAVYGGYTVFRTTLPSDAAKSDGRYSRIISSRYSNKPHGSGWSNLGDKHIVFYNSDSQFIGVTDSAYSTAASFKESLINNPIEVYYELAEPIEVDLEEPINMDYEVSDFGTEEVISEVPTTPLKADIIYQFNAVDRIRDNSRHTAEAEELLNAKADKTAVEEIQKKELQLSVKDNGNIVLSNANGVSKEFMPATPSGDPMHYAYIAAGAEWNDTDQIIQKTAPWKTDEKWRLEEDGTYTYWEEPAIIDHLPKHWYLNGLGDITEEQMMTIYIETFPLFKSPHWINALRGRTSRTNLFPNFFYASQMVKDISASFYNYKTDVICLNAGNYNISTILDKQVMHTFYECSVKRVIGVIDFVNNQTSAYGSICRNLIDFNMKNIKFNHKTFEESPNISKRSVLYLIQNASPTTTITITLHPDAYVRIANQPDIIEALEAKNAALQGTGGSISLVSA